MRISANVEIVNRDYNTRTKSARASLALGLKPTAGKKDVIDREIFFIISTVQNRAGTKFVVRSSEVGLNVENIFDRFMAEGKATVRIKCPARDICISKADTLQLKSFLTLIKRGLSAKTSEDIEKLSLTSAAFSATASMSQISKPKTKLLITDKKEYPITTNFPSSLELLVVNGINLKKVDSRILKLQHLVSLDLSQNSVKDISVFSNQPSNKLHCLKELKLADNLIESWPASFCANPHVQSHLRLLDLSGNKFKIVPFNIYRLKNLVTLKLANNPELACLPSTVGQMASSLKTVDLNQCLKLKYLPGSVIRWRLDTLSIPVSTVVSAFDLDSDLSQFVLSDTLAEVPTLVDICLVKARSQLNNLSDEDIPTSLIERMETMQKCFCLNWVHRSSCLVGLAHINSSEIAQSLEIHLAGGGYSATLACQAAFCSRKCFQRFKRNRFAL